MTEIRMPWLLATLAALVLAALTGGVAAWVQSGSDSLRFVTFGVMTLPCWFGLTALLRTRGDRPEPDEQSVEMLWITQATSGAFLDLVLALGVATTVTAILGVESVPTVAFCVLALADAGARYALLQRLQG